MERVQTAMVWVLNYFLMNALSFQTKPYRSLTVRWHHGEKGDHHITCKQSSLYQNIMASMKIYHGGNLVKKLKKCSSGDLEMKKLNFVTTKMAESTILSLIHI